MSCFLRIVKYTWNSHAARKRVINLCSFVCTDGNTVGHNYCMHNATKGTKQQFCENCRTVASSVTTRAQFQGLICQWPKKLNNIRSHFVFILLFHSFQAHLAQFLKTYCLRCDYKVSLKGRGEEESGVKLCVRHLTRGMLPTLLLSAA